MDLLAVRNQIIHAAIPGSYGGLPTFAANDAILCGGIQITPLELTRKQRENMQAFYGNQGQVNVKEMVKLSFKTEWTGSGAAGTAPRIGRLFKACNFSENILATAVTGTAQAGGSTTTIKLATGASAVNNFYQGMPISITGGAGNGSLALITSYNGTSKIATVSTPFLAVTDATSMYSILPNVRYIPTSELSDNAGSDLGIRYNRNGIEHIALGARGTLKATLMANDINYLSWDYTALVGTITDTAAAAADFTGILDPKGLMSNLTRLINVHGLVSPNVAFKTIDIDIANQVVYPDLVGQDSILITDRQAKATIEILAVKNAVKDWYAATRNNTLGVLTASHGTAAGERIAVISNSVQMGAPKYGELDGLTTHQLDADLKPSNTGNDDVIFTFY
jgi:hypothetical protein